MGRVQISCDICTRFARYLYSTKQSWIINSDICPWTLSVPRSSTDNVRGQIYEHDFDVIVCIFSRQLEATVYLLSINHRNYNFREKKNSQVMNEKENLH